MSRDRLVSRERIFRPVIASAPGGVSTEVPGDVALRLVPPSERDVAGLPDGRSRASRSPDARIRTLRLTTRGEGGLGAVAGAARVLDRIGLRGYGIVHYGVGGCAGGRVWQGGPWLGNCDLEERPARVSTTGPWVHEEAGTDDQYDALMHILGVEC